MFDITQGNYRVFRTVSYDRFPKSQIMLDVSVRAVKDTEWTTDIYVKGVYDGPNDVVSNQDYELTWTTDSGRLLEAGGVTLLLASGKKLRQTWSSIITPDADPDEVARVFRQFPKKGQIATASISPFAVSGKSMNYTWEGTVKPRPRS